MTKEAQQLPTHYGSISPSTPVYQQLESDSSDQSHNNNNHHQTNLYNCGAPLLIHDLKENIKEEIEVIKEEMDTLAHAHFVLSEQAIVDTDRLHHIPAAGTATIPSEVANMTKNLIGGGVLSLSGGIALYANSPTAIVSAILWVVLLGAVFGYFCLLIGKACDMSLSGTYRECWERTVGHRGGLGVAVASTVDPLIGIFANASILSQSLQLILQGIDIHLNVTECLLLITFLALLPLCLMKNLDALAPFSALGMASVLCALGCMTFRYLDGSYLPDGQFYNDIPINMRPSFGTSSRPFSMDALPFVCMVYTSFDMHYNSPRFYAELKDASIPRFGQVVGYSFGITAAIYFSIAAVGFLTFGANSDSYILNNYSTRDSLATLSRITIGLCSLVSYPLNFIGVRDNCLDILGITDEVDTDAKLNLFTILLLSIMTLASCFVTDLGLINSAGGGATATFVCFVFPGLMFREAMKKHGRGPKWESSFATTLMILGAVMGCVGVYVSTALA
ncbi:Putative sodium-coupled neutral amino acid transporter 11 [Seminavis robusta]|uniref:Sodium-coupled neutral amino acid transporter 11 n=1 Tax=Seminavis robusta TaxID=568900 RepID=A0A9N8H8Q3_9STRA|nr:Putative sodium-coupled neutral amino acid transporter 11 [Seminavis robusta]|eukprot:Sro248_g098350.1 Putative sodium-coupled neutral amino acid transporter 11 (506) ;mRNA; r:47362-48969